jgi:opine dehydrogenase
MKICVIGAGNTGQAVAAYLKSMGIDSVLNTRSEEKAATINKNGITSEGGIIGKFKIPATVDLFGAVKDADLILLMTIASAHKEVAEKLKPLLVQGQKILIFNSNWGAFEFKQVLADDIEQKNLTVAETNAQLFISSTEEVGRVNMEIKKQVLVCATNPNKTQFLLDSTKSFFPQFKKSSSIFETTLASTNPVIHVPIVLLNLVRMENSQHFMFYGDGVSYTAVNLILDIDKERVAVARMLGCEIPDVLTTINSFWEIKYDNLYDALTRNQTYLKAVGPKSLDHRYITEDIPFGIIPVAEIGDLIGVDTPYTDALIDLLRHSINPRLISGGVNFSKEDFQLK